MCKLSCLASYVNAEYLNSGPHAYTYLRHLPSLHRLFAALMGLLEFLLLHVVTDSIGLHELPGSTYSNTDTLNHCLLVLPHLRLLNWFNPFFHNMTEESSMPI